nr:molybdopterin biosynthesis protein [Cystoclonium purpureum f. stellatum]
MLNPIINKIDLSDKEYKTYSRQLILENIGSKGQQRLKKAKILIIGAGGLGCPSMLYLASAGIGCLGIIDNDRISQSNLHRQILYTRKNINELKTISAQKKLQQINPVCKINIHSYQLTEKNAYKLIQEYDLILDTSDNFSTRYLIDEVCYKLHKIHIYGAIQSYEGHISVFNYKSGPKYSDLYPNYLKLKNNNCNNIGILGVIPGIIGLLQATEAIKIILGIGKILSGYLLIYDSLKVSFKKIKIKKEKKRQNKCKVLIPINLNTINGYYLKHNLSQRQKISLIDVRQELEFKKNHILKSINIPLKNITTKKNIDLINKLANNTKIILYCSKNSRSIIASSLLNKYQIPHYRLKDGLYHWIE